MNPMELHFISLSNPRNVPFLLSEFLRDYQPPQPPSFDTYLSPTLRFTPNSSSSRQDTR